MLCEPPDVLQALLFRLISNPEGAWAVIFPVRFVPDTLKLVDEDAVPAVVLTAAGAPDVEITGVTFMVFVAALLVAVPSLTVNETVRAPPAEELLEKVMDRKAVW